MPEIWSPSSLVSAPYVQHHSSSLILLKLWGQIPPMILIIPSKHSNSLFFLSPNHHCDHLLPSVTSLCVVVCCCSWFMCLSLECENLTGFISHFKTSERKQLYNLKPEHKHVFHTAQCYCLEVVSNFFSFFFIFLLKPLHVIPDEKCWDDFDDHLAHTEFIKWLISLTALERFSSAPFE